METLSMSAEERRRLMEFGRVKEKRISIAEAGRRLGISERQARRLWKRYLAQQDRGLIHGLRGRKPGNAAKGKLREKALGLCREKYARFNVAHAAEMLEREKVQVCRQTLWRWLKPENLVTNPRKVKQHRSRRERRACVGELVQMDGSTHKWLGEDQPACVLFVMIDDATGLVHLRFYESEDTASAFDLFGRYARKHGLPEALYVDRDSIYLVNDPEAKLHSRQAGKKEPLTQFGRAMEEVQVRIIAANSPQAKGRVERVNRTLQDRLVNELSAELEGREIKGIKEANAFLEREFVRRFNERFRKPPREGVNRHRAIGRGLKLEEVLCHRESRVVGEDWCVQYENRILQIDRKHEGLSLARKSVEVLEDAGGKLKLRHGGRLLIFKEIMSRPAKMPAKKVIPERRKRWRPGHGHGWNRDARATMRKKALASAGNSSGDSTCPIESHGEVKPAPLRQTSLRSARLRSAGLTSPPGG